MTPRRDIDRVEDIAHAVDLVQERVGRDRERFFSDVDVQWLVVAQLGIVGEAARATSAAFREAHPGLPWRDLIRMRNELVHEYFDIELDEVWEVIEAGLPEIRATARRILASEGL